jgi:hypothetical protein
MPRRTEKKARRERREVARVRALVLDPGNGCPDIERADAKVLLDEIDRLAARLDRADIQRTES